jgi:hypothetical protein
MRKVIFESPKGIILADGDEFVLLGHCRTHLDLRRISEGIVLNQPKFGYIEIARGDMSLRGAIDTSQWQDGENWMDRVTIIHQTCFDRETGKEL